MTPERWRRIKDVFQASLELQPPEREEYLAKSLADDPAAVAEVRSLLASHEAAGGLMEKPAYRNRTAQVAEGLRDRMLGATVGGYKVLELIGHGGMGAVYRAVPSGDGVPVAIKVIRRGLDSQHMLRRFRQECRILSGLDHLNIARLLDSGTTPDGQPYFVMEYIAGLPIDEYADQHRLSTRNRLELVQQVCAGVQAAHDRQVVHRDIKPGNILVTADGVPKLLDFGIAKLLDPEAVGQTLDPTATIMRMMTPEYASPEQVRGETITPASDIYTLGVLLYELLTGRRPYRLKSRAPHEIAQAICDTEPERPSTAVRRCETITRGPSHERMTLTPALISEARSSDPAQLKRTLAGKLDNIVLMAMRKQPERRYRSAQALADDLQRYLEGRPVEARPEPRIRRMVKTARRNRAAVGAGVAGMVAVAVLAVVVWRIWTRPVAPTALKARPVTTLRGDERQPMFSPDGSRIAFSWASPDSSHSDIYLQNVAGGPPERITRDPADDTSPVWSPDGQRLAFLRQSKTETTIYLAPLPAGVHGKLTDLAPGRVDVIGRDLAWSPDGRFLVAADRASVQEPFRLVSIDAQTGEKKPLTTPPAKIIGDGSPAFSPDGKALAFVRATGSGVSELYWMTLPSGVARALTNDQRMVYGEAWTPDGRALVFSSNRLGVVSLWRVPLKGGQPERLSGVGNRVSDPTYSRDGNLAYSQFFQDGNIWRAELVDGGRRGVNAREWIASTQYDSSPQISPDGKKITFRSDRSGSNEIWVCNADASGPVQVTQTGGPLSGTPRWSPDGRWIAFDSRPEGQPDIFVVPAEGGPLRRITNDPAEDVVPSWSRDGRWIYFASQRGGTWQVWKAPAQGGAAIQVTHEGGFAAFESPDRRWLYYAKARSGSGLWRMPLNGGQETPVLDLKAGAWGYWEITNRGVYYLDKDVGPNGTVLLYETETRRSTPVLALTKQPTLLTSSFSVSPDGKWMLYSQIDQSGSDIMIAR